MTSRLIHLWSIARRPSIIIWVRLGISALLMALLLTQVNLGAVLVLLGQVDRGDLVLAVLVVLVTQLPAALAWKLLMDAQGLHVPFIKLGLLHAIGLFFAGFTPGGVGGDVVRMYRLQQWTGRGVESGVSVVALRVLSLLTLVALVATASIARPELASSRFAILALVALLAGALTLLALERGLKRVTARWLPHKLFSIASRLLEALHEYKHRPWTVAAAAVLLASYHVLGIMPVYLVSRGLGLDVSLADMLMLGLTARFVAFLPFSFSGIGFQEGAFVGLFAQLGLDPAHALALSVMDHLILMLVQLIGGVIYFTGWDRPNDIPAESKAKQEATIPPWK